MDNVTLIDMDDLRQKSDAVFQCLHLDCKAQYIIKDVAIRPSIVNEIDCEMCERDFFALVLDAYYLVKFGIKKKPRGRKKC